MQVVPYRAYCRYNLQTQFESMFEKDRTIIEAMMREYNLWDIFWKDGKIQVDPECGCHPPFSLYPPPDGNKRAILGAKWDKDALARKFLIHHFKKLSNAILLGAIVIIGIVFALQYFPFYNYYEFTSFHRS